MASNTVQYYTAITKQLQTSQDEHKREQKVKNSFENGGTGLS